MYLPRNVLSITILCAALSATARADAPSVIQPTKVGAGDITSGVHGCIQQSKSTMPDLADRARIKHCGCFMDYMRSQAKDDFARMQAFVPTMTPESVQKPIQVCYRFATKNQDVQKPKPTPFSKKLDLSSEAVYGAAISCKLTADKGPVKDSIAFCSCFADVLRSVPRKTLKKIEAAKAKGQAAFDLLPQDKLAICLKGQE